MTVGIMELPHEGLRLRGVTLAGDPNRGVRTVTGLELLFSTPGITIVASPTTPERTLEWSTLDQATCSDTLQLAGGSTTTVMVLVSAGRSVEFLLPGETVAQDQVDYLRAALPIWLARYKGGVAAAAPVASIVPIAPLGAPTVTAVGGPPIAAAGGPSPYAGPQPVSPSNVAAAGAAVAAGAAFANTSAPAPAGPDVSVSSAWSGELAPPPPPQAGTPPSAGTPPPATGLWDVGRPAPPTATEQFVNGSPLDGWGVPVVTGVAPATTVGSLGAWDSTIPPTGPDAVGEPRERKARRTRRVVLLVVLSAVVVAAGVVYLVQRQDNKAGPPSPAAQAAGAAMATSVNLRLTDLPADWSEAGSVPAGLPPATPAVRARALQTLASCVGQPVADVQGWFGSADFPDQVARVTSPTFVATPAAQVRMSSTTTVLASSSSSAALAAPLASPKFATCLGQYQVGAVATPITAQVQSVPLTTPAGVKAYGYVTTYTTTSQSTEMVGTAFIVSGRFATLLEPIAVGTAIPSADFIQAYNAVVGRIARAAS